MNASNYDDVMGTVNGRAPMPKPESHAFELEEIRKHLNDWLSKPWPLCCTIEELAIKTGCKRSQLFAIQNGIFDDVPAEAELSQLAKLFGVAKVVPAADYLPSTDSPGELVNQAVIVVNQFAGNFVQTGSLGMGVGDEAEQLSDAMAAALEATLGLAEDG